MMENKVLQSFKSKKCIVTGGTCLIGREVVKMLCDADACVKIVSLDRVNVEKRAKHIYGDLTDFNLCKELTKDVDLVFHLAGIKGSIDVTKSKPASRVRELIDYNPTTTILDGRKETWAWNQQNQKEYLIRRLFH